MDLLLSLSHWKPFNNFKYYIFWRTFVYKILDMRNINFTKYIMEHIHIKILENWTLVCKHFKFKRKQNQMKDKNGICSVKYLYSIFWGQSVCIVGILQRSDAEDIHHSKRGACVPCIDTTAISYAASWINNRFKSKYVLSVNLALLCKYNARQIRLYCIAIILKWICNMTYKIIAR